jgi:hypothetical protein
MILLSLNHRGEECKVLGYVPIGSLTSHGLVPLYIYYTYGDSIVRLPRQRSGWR